jgi:glycerol-3-phosphate cytidylyltransferase-like family protein
MAEEPENMVLSILQEMRPDISTLKRDVVDGREEVRREFSRVDERLDTMRHAQAGESFLATITVGEYEERFAEIEKRLAALEAPKTRKN